MLRDSTYAMAVHTGSPIATDLKVSQKFGQNSGFTYSSHPSSSLPFPASWRYGWWWRLFHQPHKPRDDKQAIDRDKRDDGRRQENQFRDRRSCAFLLRSFVIERRALAHFFPPFFFSAASSFFTSF